MRSKAFDTLIILYMTKTVEPDRVYYPRQIRRLSATNVVFSFKRPARRKKGAVSPCSALRSVFLFRMAVKPLSGISL